MTNNDRLTLKTDRTLIRSKWHSKRFVVAHVTAPEADTKVERQPVNLAFVVDRSGSMGGAKIRLAMQAVEEAIRRLKSADRFSVVIFDNEIDALVPGTFATPRARSLAIEELRRVDARGATNLSDGWLRGCEEVASALSEEGVNRVLLLTDGLANHGITDRDELAHHAAELRRRGVSTSTFGVGNDFDEVLLQTMAQAGGGHFYDIAGAEQIRDHIESEVGETLEVVARDVTLEVQLPGDVRVESLGAFEAREGNGRALLDLGDLVSGQEVAVVLRLAFPLGGLSSTVPAVFVLSDRDDVLGESGARLSWEYADDKANNVQPREVEVDRVVAGIFAARARHLAVDLNRQGEYERASHALKSTAKRIRSYAGKDPELRAIVDGLMSEAELFGRVMQERTRKHHSATSHNLMHSRDFEGRARRSQP